MMGGAMRVRVGPKARARARAVRGLEEAGRVKARRERWRWFEMGTRRCPPK
jgi:hypothetical protein